MLRTLRRVRRATGRRVLTRLAGLGRRRRVLVLAGLAAGRGWVLAGLAALPRLTLARLALARLALARLALRVCAWLSGRSTGGLGTTHLLLLEKSAGTARARADDIGIGRFSCGNPVG